MNLTELYSQFPGLAAFIAEAGVFSDADVDLSVLSKGLSNLNFLIVPKMPNNKSDDNGLIRAWVLRINRDVAALGCGRDCEVQVWRQAAAAGLAPELLSVSADRAFYLSRYIDQSQSHAIKTAAESVCAEDMIAGASMIPGHEIRQALTLASVEQGASPRAEALLKLINGLAGLVVPDHPMSASAQWLRYRDSLHALQTPLLAGTQYPLQQGLKQVLSLLLSRGAEIENWLSIMDSFQRTETDDQLQFCHRDLNPENVLWDGKQLLAIDFEYSCAAGPLSELATILASHDLAPAEQAWLTRRYLEARGLTQGELLTEAVVASVHTYWVFSCCWALLQANETQDQTYLDWFHFFYPKLP